MAASRGRRERLRVLDEASALLSAEAEPEVALRHVAHLVVPGLADWCILDVVDEGGAVRRLEVAHVDRAQHERAEQVRRVPAGLSAPLDGGASVLYTDLTDARLTRPGGAPERLPLLGAVGGCSAIVVPLRARGQIMGVLWLVAAESGRRYTHADLSLAEELARRCALSVDNARILAGERRERTITQSLQAITAALSTARTPAEGADVIIP